MKSSLCSISGVRRHLRKSFGVGELSMACTPPNLGDSLCGWFTTSSHNCANSGSVDRSFSTRTRSLPTGTQCIHFSLISMCTNRISFCCNGCSCDVRWSAMARKKVYTAKGITLGLVSSHDLCSSNNRSMWSHRVALNWLVSPPRICRIKIRYKLSTCCAPKFVSSLINQNTWSRTGDRRYWNLADIKMACSFWIKAK